MTASLAIPFFTPPLSRPMLMDYEESALPADLIREAQAGDERAFHAVLRACKGRILGMASRYVQSPAELEELGQEIFVNVWKGLRSYRFDAPFPNWISRVAVNACLTHIKKRKRRWGLFVQPEEPDSLERWADPAVDTAAAGRDAMERLRPALDTLKPEDRLVLTMLHIEERSVAEIAAVLQWTESNVKVRALRARQKLKDYLQRHESL
jgi:RNA polymerase sigma-70 factor, ECF subfamily